MGGGASGARQWLAGCGELWGHSDARALTANKCRRHSGPVLSPGGPAHGCGYDVICCLAGRLCEHRSHRRGRPSSWRPLLPRTGSCPVWTQLTGTRQKSPRSSGAGEGQPARPGGMGEGCWGLRPAPSWGLECPGAPVLASLLTSSPATRPSPRGLIT